MRCIDCDHFYFYESTPDYSDTTLGSAWSMGCRKDIWYLTGDDYVTQEQFVTAINGIRECIQFEPRKEER